MPRFYEWKLAVGGSAKTRQVQPCHKLTIHYCKVKQIDGGCGSLDAGGKTKPTLQRSKSAGFVVGGCGWLGTAGLGCWSTLSSHGRGSESRASSLSCEKMKTIW